MVMTTKTHAEGDLAIVRELVNTRELSPARDDIATADGLTEWLSERGSGGPRATAKDVKRYAVLRDALRDLALANNGEAIDVPAATAVLDAEARRVGLGVRFLPDGARLDVVATGPDATIGRVLCAVYGAMEDGRWARLKACRAHDCDWAFYDTARNASRVWCSMDGCGNREKARAFRRRATSARAPHA